MLHNNKTVANLQISVDTSLPIVAKNMGAMKIPECDLNLVKTIPPEVHTVYVGHKITPPA